MLQVPNGARGRLLLYTLLFPGALALDIVTPLGMADWLLEFVLVLIASAWGKKQELHLVLVLACSSVLAGLWFSPNTSTPFRIDGLNRVAAIGVMCWIAHLADRRRAAKEARRATAAELKLVQRFVPICSACKSVRDQEGEWHRVERYLSTNSALTLTHSLCPPCLAKHMAEAAVAKSNL